MKKLSTLIAFFVAATAFTVQAQWKNDKPHSQLLFTVGHMGISRVSGSFNDFDVTINAAKPDFSDAVIKMSAKTASIDTRVADRNNHLKSADFFNAEKYPEMTFSSTGIEAKGNNTYTLTGDLTLAGVTKPVSMELVYNGQMENPMSKKQTAGFHLSGTIKRSDFNFGSKFPAPMLSDEVQVQADGEFIQ